jgi:hypothetical protein
MKRKVILIFLGIVLSISSFAQTTLSFKIDNPRIIYTENETSFFEDQNLKFDVLVKASAAGTRYYALSLNLTVNDDAFNLDALAFTRGTLSPLNRYTASVNTNSNNLNVYLTSQFPVGSTNTGQFIEIPDEYGLLGTFVIEIDDKTKLAEIDFIQSSMNISGEQIEKTFGTSPSTQPYSTPNFFEGNLETLYLGRVYSEGTGWSQFGGTSLNNIFLDWEIAENTSVWDGSPSLSGDDYQTGALRIHDGAVLTIAIDAGLAADGDTDIEGEEALVIESSGTGLNSSGYFIDNGTIAYHNSGSVKVERFFDGNFYRFVSPPIAKANYGTLQGTNGTDDFWQWNEVDNQWENLNLESSGDEMSFGRGYAVAYDPGNDLKAFVGELNTGSLQYAVTYTPPWNQRGFNLVGNPYPSAIDADTFIGDNPILEGGLYFWDETLSYDGERWDYATYTLLGGTGTLAGGAGNVPDGIIASMQGFMILADQGGDVNFNNNMRVSDDAFFFKAQEEKSRIWLSVVGPEGDYNEILAGFHTAGEMGVDKSDAVKLKGNDKLALYMILEEKDYVIQGLPPFDPSESYTLSLGLDAGFAGEYVFSAREIEQFEPEVEIILEDRITGEMFDLRGTGAYTALIPDEGTLSDRFFLHINGSTSVPVIGNQKLTKVYAVNNQIIISHTGNSKILDVEVISTLGQLVVQTPVNATETTITVPGRNLVYIVKVRTSEGIESHKLLIR